MQRSIHPARLLHPIVVVWFVLLLAIAGCSPSSSAVSPTAIPESRPAISLSLSGSTSTVAIMSAIQPAFEADQPSYHLDVLTRSGAGSSSAPTIQGVADRKLDLAAINRPLKDDESALGVETVEFGKTGVAFVAHPDVGVTSLTPEQMQAIFAGNITNWADVGGPKLPITVFVRTEDNSVTDVVRDALFGKTPFPKQNQVIDKSDQLQLVIEGTPGSIGYGGWVNLRVSGTTAHPIALNGAGPGDSSYPLTQPLILCYRSDNKARIQPLLDWLRAASGQTAMHKIGVIAIH